MTSHQLKLGLGVYSKLKYQNLQKLKHKFLALIIQLLLSQGHNFGEQWLITLARNIL